VRLILAALFVSIAGAQSLSECEERLIGIANRFARDYNSYSEHYHVRTISANPDKAQIKQRERTIAEFEAVKRCECW
jgi:hypothetical protein